MYPYNYIIPNNSNGMYRNSNPLQNQYYESYQDMGDDRFLWAPFVVGGLAGTALGFGIANNNQLNSNNNRPCCGWQMMPYYYPYPQYPTYNNSNSFYY